MAEAREFMMNIAAAQIAATQVIVQNDGDKTRDIMLGRLEELQGKDRDEAKAILRAKKMALTNAFANLVGMKKGEVVGNLTVPAPKKEPKKGHGAGDDAVAYLEAASSGAATSSAPPAAVVQDQAVAYLEAASSGAATSSAPPAAVVQDQAVIEGSINFDPLAKQKASFKKLNSKARLAKLISMMEADGIGGDFLSWAESQFPAEYQVALKRVIEQFGIPGLE